ncbi:hypothetical protein P3T76_003767 [Phytophthora citrophthora]|uniref:Uncharacterized protein n=1 Tax=Phytophthora citrophthora TaxID=4793 RepID=A0AAD9LSL5_9STRA|nr:hypothetical protein P3T76_003767 [Phytophthora citrophthora]
MNIEHYVANDDLMACLTTDSFTNVTEDPVVNYMRTTPLATLYFESVSTGEQRHTGEWTARDIA